jgi:hypothetical protein
MGFLVPNIRRRRCSRGSCRLRKSHMLSLIAETSSSQASLGMQICNDGYQNSLISSHPIHREPGIRKPWINARMQSVNDQFHTVGGKNIVEKCGLQRRHDFPSNPPNLRIRCNDAVARWRSADISTFQRPLIDRNCYLLSRFKRLQSGLVCGISRRRFGLLNWERFASQCLRGSSDWGLDTKFGWRHS